MKLLPHPPVSQKKKNPCLRLTLKFAASPSRIVGTDGCCGSNFLSKHQQYLCSSNTVSQWPKRGRVSFKAYVRTYYPLTFRREGEWEGDINGMCPITPGRPNYSVRARDPSLLFPHYKCIKCLQTLPHRTFSTVLYTVLFVRQQPWANPTWPVKLVFVSPGQ